MAESTVAIRSTVVAWNWPEMWLAAKTVVTAIAEADDLHVLFFLEGNTPREDTVKIHLIICLW
jgi:hypothetical protein